MAFSFPVGLRRALGVVICSFGLAACSGGSGSGGTEGAPTDGWTGQTNIEAIFEASCAGCHGTQWSTCWDVQENATTVSGAVSSGAMPQSGSLSPSDRSTLLAWLGRGAPCSGTKPDGGGTSSGGIGAAPPVVAASEAP
jgi:hypothetical protein